MAAPSSYCVMLAKVGIHDKNARPSALKVK